MPESELSRRRQVLTGVAVAGSAMLAGCLDGLGGSGDGPEGSRNVGVIVHIPQEAFLAIQEELQQEIEEGELDEEEYQIEFQQRQQELITSETEELESWLQGESGVSIETSVLEMGSLIISAEPHRIVDILNDDQVGTLVPEDDIEDPDQPAP